MNYTRRLPEFIDLEKLSESVDNLPIKTTDIISLAKDLGYDSAMINFLKLFHGHFESRSDFYTRASELVMLIKEERRQPEEKVLSPQD